MFVCREDRDDSIDGLLPRLDSEGRMTLSVGRESMSVLSSTFELVRDMVGEVGGVLKVSKSDSGVDISQVTCSDRLVGAARRPQRPEVIGYRQSF